MKDRQRRQFDFENRVLELIENQLRNDDSTLTQSDLRGAVGALVSKMIGDEKRITVDHNALQKTARHDWRSNVRNG